MMRVPVRPGLPARDQHKAGRLDILNTSFATFERNIREQLARILRPGGFDPARDITAIAVNRWPHGYAYEYNPLFDPDWPEGNEPHAIGRAPFGQITIANSDAGAAAYTDRRLTRRTVPCRNSPSLSYGRSMCCSSPSRSSSVVGECHRPAFADQSYQCGWHG